MTEELLATIEQLKEENETLKECNKSQSEVINNVLIPQRERLEEEIRKLKEKISEITMVADDEKQSIEHMLELEEENKKLREDNRFLTKISKEYMEKENIIEITEFTGLYKDDLEKENERLKEELEIATKCSSQEEGKLRKLEKENKRLREENEELKEYKSMYEGLC